MSTESTLKLGSLEVLVVRKPIKNLHLAVLPPDGRIRVASPEGMNDNAIRTLVSTRLPWIKKQQAKFAGQQRQTKREFVSGETHYLFGKPYRLDLVHLDHPPVVYLKGKNRIILQARPYSAATKRSEIMTHWYREQLRPVIEELITKWEEKIGVSTNRWGIRRMKTRWGTCNRERASILINLELAKKPMQCVEYVVVHELLHLIESKHNHHFLDLMTEHLPKWRSTKDELNGFILSHEEWNH